MRAKTNSQIGGMSVSDAREQPAVQPPKKRMSRGTRVLVIIVCILLAIALILAGTVLAMVVCTVLGMVIERLAYKPLRQATSLAVLITAIGVTEILYFAKATVNREVDATAYLVAAVFYLVMNFILSRFFSWLEKKYRY